MFFTNGKIIIEKNDNVLLLSDAVNSIESYMSKEYRKLVKFEADSSAGFPAYKVPEDVTFSDMAECLGKNNIGLRAINDSELESLGIVTVEHKYKFNAEEMAEIAQEQSQVISEKTQVESEKRATMQQFSAQLKELDRKIENSANKYLQGFEERQVDCKIIYHFEEGKKYYHSVETDEVIKIENMTPADYTMQIKHSGFEWGEMEVITDESHQLTEGPAQEENNEGNEEEVQEDENDDLPL